MTDPRYTHDCEGCTFHGQVFFALPTSTMGESYDLYTCGDSILLRYGNEAHEYLSLYSRADGDCTCSSGNVAGLSGNAILAKGIRTMLAEKEGTP